MNTEDSKKKYIKTPNCGKNSRLVLLIGAILWTVFTFIFLIWILNYVRSLRSNDNDAGLASKLNPTLFIFLSIFYIIFTIAIIITVLFLIFKKHKFENISCNTTGIFKIIFLVYGVIMLYAVIHVFIALSYLYTSINKVFNGEESVIIDTSKTNYLYYSGIVLLIISSIYLIFAIVMLYVKNNVVVIPCKEGDVPCQQQIAKIDESLIQKEKTDTGKSQTLQEQYKSEDFDRIKMAKIVSPINTTTIDNIYPKQLSPSSSKDAKAYADKSLEICTQPFEEGKERFNVALGDPKRDSCKYWGLKPSEKVSKKPIAGGKENIYSITS